VCLPPPDCNPFVGPCETVCYGFCVEPVAVCYGDEECDANEVCVFELSTGPNRPLIAPPSGTCQPAPGSCTTNETCASGQVCIEGACIDELCATVRCGAGEVCKVDAAGTAECVQLQACASTEECRQGTCSVETGDCNAAPGCADGQDCVALCYGYCL
jgi:hypothetical protein